jgi:TPP-dependent pyruvate/acetoin dehydrogenase alpha subunit
MRDSGARAGRAGIRRAVGVDVERPRGALDDLLRDHHFLDPLEARQIEQAWGKSQEEALAAECQQRIEAAVERYLATGPHDPQTIFDHLYAELPRAYAAQRRELASDA